MAALTQAQRSKAIKSMKKALCQTYDTWAANQNHTPVNWLNLYGPTYSSMAFSQIRQCRS